MKDTYSKSRQQAEMAFRSVQMQFFAKNDAVGEMEAIAHARDAKTLRLREARFAKEMADRTSTTFSLVKRAAKR